MSAALHLNKSGNGRRRIARAITAVGAVIFCCISQLAGAVPIQAGIAGTVSFNFLSPAPIDVRTFGSNALSGPSGELLLDSGLNPSPFLLASGEIIPNFFGRSAAILTYGVEIVGPNPTVAVQVTASGAVHGNSTVSPTEDLFAGFAMRALWWLEDNGGQVFADGIETPSMRGSFADSFNRTTELTLFTNRSYRVSLLADIGVRGGNAFAYIDPVFAFAPGIGSEYSFLFSDGVGNGSSPDPDPNPNPIPVPEPASLALLAAGLLPLGLARKRRDSRRA